MEQDDSRLFSKSENTLIAENFTTLLRENVVPKDDIRYLLHFASLMQESDKLIKASSLEALKSELTAFVFKHMKDLALDDVAESLQFLEGTDMKKSK